MKKVLFVGCFLMNLIAFGQTSIFLEDFDGATVNMSSSSSGTGNWAINSTFQTSGTSSDSASVQTGDTLYLESNSFSTVGYSFVDLSFDQICKIDFFDRARIEYSTNNGSTWTTLTSSDYNGGGNYLNNSFSSASYSIWSPGSAGTIPNQSWWRSESFDLSAAANQSQVKVRFVLIDADNNGARNNYGWLVDDVEVVGSPCELIPPAIAYSGTIYQGAVYGTGPYTVEADISDASGIASASLTYTVNSGSSNTLTMNNTGGNIYAATIPSANVGDTICYSIDATDNTTCSNQSSLPSIGCNQFIVSPNAPPNCVGTPIGTFNYLESFATFTPGTGTNSGGVGTLNNNWQNSTNDSHDWWVYNNSTPSNNTGPTSDHSLGDANFMYVEASGHSNQTANLITPCFNLGGLSAPKFSFWYYMTGANLGELHLDIHDGNNWILDVTPAIIGAQAAQWLNREVNLSSYAGTIVQLRFRGITGGGYTSDIAIDDIEIIEPIAADLILNKIVSPSGESCNGSSTEQVTIEIENLGSLAQDTIPLAFQVNGGTIVRDTSFFNLLPGNKMNHTFQPTFNMSNPGTYNIDSWIELSNDGDVTNDSILGNTVSTNTILTNLPDTTTFDSYPLGTLSGRWANSSANTYNWAVNSGSTTSGQTGPTGDTTSTAGIGNYVYYEATNVPQGEVGVFFSECIDITNTNQPELKFYYHMSGIEMGELHLDLNLNGFQIQDIVPAVTGNQGSAWIEQTVDLSPYKGVIKVIFRAIRGTGYRSDIAIDQISLRDAMPLALAKDEVLEKTSVYPNPFSNNLVLKSAETAVLKIYSISGRLVSELSVKKGLTEIETVDFAKGIYFATITSENNIETVKIIKQ